MITTLSCDCDCGGTLHLTASMSHAVCCACREAVVFTDGRARQADTHDVEAYLGTFRGEPKAPFGGEA